MNTKLFCMQSDFRKGEKMIKYLIMDVDGTLTDGKLYIGNNGELFKCFNIKDGYGISKLLPLHKITPVIMTGRSSDIVLKRCIELGISEIMQDVSDKRAALNSFLIAHTTSLEQIAFIGDDIPDLECMKQCGISGCPYDAVDEIKAAATYVCMAKGGEGAVREFIQYICNSKENDNG